MLSRFKTILSEYPRQFWLLSFIMMMAWFLQSLMWSYLLLYISQRLGQPLSQVAWLMTLNASIGMITTFLGGAIADHYGRKGVMVFSILFSAAGWFFFRTAGTPPVFAVLMIITGASSPLYRLATDAMVSDLVPGEKRLNAYSVMRMGNNLGVALGPAIGGLLASISYGMAFTVIGIGFAVIGILSALFLKETRPHVSSLPFENKPGQGYGQILKDRSFRWVLLALTLNRICTSILWLMLAAYTKQNFGLSERLFGLIPTTNAVMVIVLQLLITRKVNRQTPESAMVAGGLIYAVSIFAVVFGTGFWWFWLCMVGSTIGEMILIPTATTYVSRLAPPALRARYMSLYTLTWGIGTALGPLMAGFASDLFSPKAIWYTAGIAGFAGFLVFLRIASERREEKLVANSQP